MSNANEVKLYYTPEDTYGVVPSPAATEKTLRFVSESLKQESEFLKSDEINATRMVSDIIRTHYKASGNIGYELSYATYDDFFKYGLLATSWASEVTVTATTISFTATTNTISDSGSGFGSISANSWIRVTGATNSANNGYFKVATASASALTVTPTGVLVDESAGASVTVLQGKQITNGVQGWSLAMEKEYTDLTNIWERLAGMVISGFSMNVNEKSKIGGTFNFLGKSVSSETATLGDGSPTAVNTNPIYSAVGNTYAIYENQATYGCTNFSFTLDNSVRERLNLGTEGLLSVGKGRLAIEGTVQSLFSTVTVMDKYLNNTNSSLALVLLDDDNNAYIFDWPSIKYTDGQRVAGGIDTDVIVDLKWEAYEDATESTMMRIQKFPGS